MPITITQTGISVIELRCSAFIYSVIKMLISPGQEVHKIYSMYLK